MALIKFMEAIHESNIRTFAAVHDEVSTNPILNSPGTDICQATLTSEPPNYVGNGYFCDTACESG